MRVAEKWVSVQPLAAKHPPPAPGTMMVSEEELSKMSKMSVAETALEPFLG